MIISNYIEFFIYLLVFLFLYTYLLYPLLLFVCSKLFLKPVKKSDNYYPDITVIIAAYNEEELIKDCIISIFNSNYLKGKIHVIVGSDGSTDGTISIIETLKKDYNLLEYYELPRSGKNKLLNELDKKVNTELILYLDADCRVREDTIFRLVQNFADPEVGAVLSSLQIITDDSHNDDNSGRLGEYLYQKYESFLRNKESLIYSNINSLGTLYGIRKELDEPIPNDFVCDDLFRLLNTASKKKRIIYQINSIVTEVRKKSLSSELQRRIRLVAGGLSTIWVEKKLLNPKFGWVSLFLWSHKIFRWLTPLICIGIAILTLLISKDSYLFFPLLIIQLVIYLSALLGWIFEKMTFNFFFFKVSLFFVSMNIAFLLGIIKFIRRGQNSIWERIDTK